MFVVKFKKLLLIVLLSVGFLLTVICVPTAVKATSPKPSYTVVVDAGHGGADGGVQGVNTGVYERELNLSIAYKVKAELEKAQINVVMTRTTSDGALDTMLTQKQEDMEKRKKIIMDASPDCVVSIHQNKYTQQSRRGAQAFFWGDSSLAEIEQTYEERMTSYESEQQAAFDTWFDTIKSQLSEDVAASLQNQITALEARVSELEYMVINNDYRVALAVDDTDILVDDLGNTIVADWKYEEV